MEDFKVFRERLEQEHKWPAVYMFKFVVPKDKIDEIKAVLKGIPLSERQSKTGKYISVTAKTEIKETDEVIELYKKAHEIEGLIAL